MFHFECDYASGAAPQVLRALAQANESQHFGYGEDEHCRAAAELIGRLCAAQVGVHFVPGGTQANLLVAAAALRPFEGVLCADTGHINVHETGAVEATGHKVLALPSVDGRLTADQIRQAAQRHRLDSTREHTVRPGLVYLSHPTELGTLYTRAQLEDISQACREANLLLYVDGARLAYGLAAMPEVDLPFLARICDAFTLGGTKAGLLFGEAVVLPHLALSRDFRYHMKQRGAMLAKGWLMGLQFRALLEDGAYVSLAARANAMAQDLKRALVGRGVPFLVDTMANQIFPILPRSVLDALEPSFSVSAWEAVDDQRAAVRVCMSSTTSPSEAEALSAALMRALDGISVKNFAL